MRLGSPSRPAFFGMVTRDSAGCATVLDNGASATSVRSPSTPAWAAFCLGKGETSLRERSGALHGARSAFVVREHPTTAYRSEGTPLRRLHRCLARPSAPASSRLVP